MPEIGGDKADDYDNEDLVLYMDKTQREIRECELSRFHEKNRFFDGQD